MLLTLHGWSFKGGPKNYDSLPNIKLVKKDTSSVPYGNGTYFGTNQYDQSFFIQADKAGFNFTVQLFINYKLAVPNIFVVER